MRFIIFNRQKPWPPNFQSLKIALLSVFLFCLLPAAPLLSAHPISIITGEALAEALVMAHRSVPGTIKLPKSARFVTTNVLPTETVAACKKAAAISRLNSFGMSRLMLNGEVFIFVLSRRLKEKNWFRQANEREKIAENMGSVNINLSPEAEVERLYLRFELATS
jgi:hypothetical protein